MIRDIGFVGIVLIILGILGIVGLVFIASTRSMTTLENVFLQALSLAIGIGVSLFVSRQSAEKTAREIIKPHARSAFRRLISLYNSLSRAVNAIRSLDDSKDDPKSLEDYRLILAMLDAIVTEQLSTADDALEDWRDVVPEDVAELKQKLQSDDTMEDEE